MSVLTGLLRDAGKVLLILLGLAAGCFVLMHGLLYLFGPYWLWGVGATAAIGLVMWFLPDRRRVD